MSKDIDYTDIIEAVRQECARCVHGLTTLSVYISRLDGHNEDSMLISEAARDVADVCMDVIDQVEKKRLGAGATPQN